MLRRIAIVILLSFFWLPAAHAAEEALDSRLHEQVVRVPVTETHLTGAKQVQIVMTIFKPDGDGPFPLLVLSHGSPRGGETERRNMKRIRYINQSGEFVRMGFVVVLPTRRGYGESEGSWAEYIGDCSRPEYYKSGMESTKDLLAAVQHMKRQPYVDGKRIVLAGQSAGGFASLAAASVGFDGLAGVLNFSGGRGSSKPDSVCTPSLLTQAMEKFGATSRVPTLWHYSEKRPFLFSGTCEKDVHRLYRGGRESDPGPAAGLR